MILQSAPQSASLASNSADRGHRLAHGFTLSCSPPASLRQSQPAQASLNLWECIARTMDGRLPNCVGYVLASPLRYSQTPPRWREMRVQFAGLTLSHTQPSRIMSFVCGFGSGSTETQQQLLEKLCSPP
ncbi:unnamed protein product [Polarella glacialis]|uniref:Uncharacterized protein n=1 Tax=Polarella glacialis TaxID=89957 RepID=A0A813LKY5_POLGL|nr:unnamed protein product [Polarella glacialis]